MPTEINAAFIGDSHGMIAQAAAEANDITFRHTITAASALFAGAHFAQDADGKPALQPAANRLDPAVHDAKKINQRLKKASDISQGFQRLFDDPVPVFANIGTTARTFVQRIVTAQEVDGTSGQAMSRKLAKRAAKEFFGDFLKQYAEIATHCPEVYFFYGPTRFAPDTRDLWLAYDDAIKEELAMIGVEMLDLRANLGDADLLLRQEFYPDPDDHVHANQAWGLAVIDGIRNHESLQTGT